MKVPMLVALLVGTFCPVVAQAQVQDAADTAAAAVDRTVELVAIVDAALAPEAARFEYDPTPDERALVGLVARVSFNEALDSYYDLAMIWQVVEGHGDSARERYSWLAHHSRCVSGVLTQDQARARPGNCVWARNLRPDGHRPRGWINEQHGEWTARIERRWLSHLDRVRALVVGVDSYRPCAETPQSWDGVRYGRARVAPAGTQRRILDCGIPFTTVAGEEGLHNFPVTWRPVPATAEPVAEPAEAEPVARLDS